MNANPVDAWIRGMRTGVARLRQALWSDGRGPILVAISLGWLLSIGTRLVFPALLPRIVAEFSLDNTTAGLLLSAMWIAYAAAQFPGGLLGDRIGERRILVASVLVAGGGLGVGLAVPVLSVFVLGVVVFGLGSGLYGTTRVTALSDIYPERGATAIAINNAAGNVGTAGLPVLAGLLAGGLGWRAGVWILVPAFVLTGGWLWLVVPDRTSRSDTGSPEPSRPTARRIGRAVSRGPVLLAFVLMVLMGFVYQGFTGFLPTYLVTVKGLSTGRAATVFGVFFAGAIAIQPVAGSLADRFGEPKTLLGILACAAVTLAGYTVLGGVWVLGGLAALSSVQLAFWPVVFRYTTRALPADLQGSGFGLLRSAYLLLAAGGPAVVGAFADVGAFDEAFLLLATLAAAATGLALLLPGVD